MKNNILKIILLLVCTYIHSMEFAGVSTNITPQNIGSNSAEIFELAITRRRFAGAAERPAFYNLELSVAHDDRLRITLDQTRIDSLEPGDNIRINMEIINNYSFFFNESTIITINMSNEDYQRSFQHRFTIRAVENFWLFVILILTLMLICVFIIIYVKTNKEEKNAG